MAQDPPQELVPSPGEREDIRAWWAVFESHRDELEARTLEAARTIPDLAPLVDAQRPEQRRAQSEHSHALRRRAVVEDDWEPLLRNLREEGARYAMSGVSLASWYRLAAAFREGAMDAVARDLANDPPGIVAALRGLGRYLDVSLAAIGQGHLETKQHIIERQQGAIREMSTPVLRLLDRFLVVPVVGVVDGDRARQLTESMLHGIRHNRARVVVMDITAVPVVDSRVANGIVQTVEAARLMGSEVILTGISPEIAQTLVGLGGLLGDVETHVDLQAGVEVAMRRLGLSLVREARPSDGTPAKTPSPT